jgi:hypothetical protein
MFQSLDTLLQAHDSRCSILCTSGLAHLDLLLEVCVEERISDVCRVHVHVPFGSDDQHRSVRSVLSLTTGENVPE